MRQDLKFNVLPNPVRDTSNFVPLEVRHPAHEQFLRDVREDFPMLFRAPYLKNFPMPIDNRAVA